MQSSKHRLVIQTDHQVIVDICAQTLITATKSIIRINFKLIRAFQFFNQYNFDVCYKLKKPHHFRYVVKINQY